MGQSSAQYHQFFIEIKKSEKIWTLRDEGVFPSPISVSGNRVMPFWSSKRRVQSIIKNVNTYSLFKPYEISYQDFINRWLPGLKNDHFLVGINWTGSKVTGYDLEPEEVLKHLNNLIF
ncbi:DUF2750 domain-containing protein [Leptospira interrogans]|uniref:DUF2750 domain-containing protein n=1 Tax=Leptospira interrogans TaxID=173 RepID=UPI0010BF8E51|nr:DUF2750 domain-containing protein [Leptospira interrogans]KAA1268702.1 DUF2750 domain-containing protein [Leptospira interrogans serovar Weerasinghe]QCO38911.1 DUF2750 domain-containing protein [Leptospira interrogans]QCO42654.1 DUF2750 domain-containing protein [Leptospira interrogans]ULG81366.1 DUF2750 domain-containing protein [Leptospira interrogans]ULG91806.1 DUF2750 domain-containing protein [Leptospira interrogans]